MSKKLDKQPCYTVSEETIKETKRCKKGFSCLKEQREDLCQVDSCVDDEVPFIKCMNKDSCSYQGTLGNGIVCYCPTRKELYNKHGI